MTANRPDLLAAVLSHFSVRASVFFTGNLCGHVDFAEASGYLHLLRAGRVELHDASGYRASHAEPGLVFYSRPLKHWFDTDPVIGADLACATVTFDHAAFNPVVRALPPRFECRLAELDSAGASLELLFAEAFAERPGRREVLNRLFEIVLIELLRASIRRGEAATGFLRGLAHPQLGRALAAIHEEPQGDWSIATLARTAAMSRSGFAAAFREHVGETPGAYLARWRVSVAQALLRRGRPLKHVSGEVGYASHAGFLRAFKAVLGVSPSAWLRAGATPQEERGLSARDQAQREGGG